jgi:hypothetical protein
MSLLLALAGAVVDPPDPPDPPLLQFGGGGLGMPYIRRDDIQPALARDMRDVQDIITALFALNRIF